MLVSLQIQGAPTELASVLAAIGGISMPVDIPVAPAAALPAPEPKQKKAATKQVATAPEPEPVTTASTVPAEPEPASIAADPAPAEPEARAQTIQQPAEEPKGDRLSLEKIRGVFNEKLAGHRDFLKGLLTKFDSKGLTEFYGKSTPEQHAEFFKVISAL